MVVNCNSTTNYSQDKFIGEVVITFANFALHTQDPGFNFHMNKDFMYFTFVMANSFYGYVKPKSF